MFSYTPGPGRGPLRQVIMHQEDREVKAAFLIAGIFALFILGGSVMADNQDLEKTKVEITEVIRASIEWPFPEKGTVRLFSALAKDSSFFIFHPDSKSTIVGFEPFRQMTESFFMQPEMKPLGTEIKDLRVNLSASGDCAWWSCLLDDWGEYRGKAYAWKNARWTGVLEKREGTWVIVQMHFSIASDAGSEEEAAGEEKKE